MNYNGFPGNLTYDSRGRLSRIQFSGSGAVFYSYDYAYDNFGNRIKKSYVGGSTVENYSWTRGRLLSGITDYSGGTIGSYTYNADGIRYSKTVGGVTTTYYYDGSMLLGEDRSNGKKLRYCYDREGICGFRYYNGSQWNSYTYVKNIQGDIVLIKDEMGVPRVKYSYDPWGNVTAECLNLDGGSTNPEETELATLNPFRYRGYYYDEESKLYYLITRYYDPWCGQFISPDSFSYLDPETIGGINLYAYCNYNPIMYVDPRGQAFFVFFVGALVGFALSFTVSAGIQAVFNGGKVNWLTALIDGAFGAISGVLWMVPGLGAVATGLVNAGLTFANGVITTGIENEWNYSWQDFVSIAISSLVSGVVSRVTRNQFLKAGGRKVLERTHKFVGTVSKRILTGYYDNSVDIISKALKSSFGQVWKKVIDLNFGEKFYKDWLMTLLQALFSVSFSRGLNGLK